VEVVEVVVVVIFASAVGIGVGEGVLANVCEWLCVQYEDGCTSAYYYIKKQKNKKTKEQNAKKQ